MGEKHPEKLKNILKKIRDNTNGFHQALKYNLLNKVLNCINFRIRLLRTKKKKN